MTPRGCGVAVLLIMLTIASGCGGGESASEEPSQADTQLAAASFEDTFGEPPDGCEAGYDTITQDFTDYDVTYCYSGETFAGKPFNTGCYITETGDDVTLALRNIRDSTDIC